MGSNGLVLSPLPQMRIELRMAVDAARAELQRAEAIYAFSLHDPGQPEDARAACRYAVEWARGRLAGREARLAVVEDAIRAAG